MRMNQSATEHLHTDIKEAWSTLDGYSASISDSGLSTSIIKGVAQMAKGLCKSRIIPTQIGLGRCLLISSLL